jgi:transcriptional regulator with XRE-family HTH domain
MALTLRDIRKSKGLEPTQVLEIVREQYPHIAPKQRSGITNWENQGIRDIRVIRALAAIYNHPLEEIEAAALHCKELFNEKQRVCN